MSKTAMELIVLADDYLFAMKYYRARKNILGATVIEYVLIAGMIAMVMLAALKLFGMLPSKS